MMEAILIGAAVGLIIGPLGAVFDLPLPVTMMVSGGAAMLLLLLSSI